MDTQKIKDAAANLQNKAEEFKNSPEVQDAVAKGKEFVNKGIEKGKEILNSPRAKEYEAKGKDLVDKAKEKFDDFLNKK